MKTKVVSKDVSNTTAKKVVGSAPKASASFSRFGSFRLLTQTYIKAIETEMHRLNKLQASLFAEKFELLKKLAQVDK